MHLKAYLPMKRLFSTPQLAHLYTGTMVQFAPDLCLKLCSLGVHSLNYPINYCEIPRWNLPIQSNTYFLFIAIRAKTRLQNVSRHKFLTTHLQKRVKAIMFCILPFEPVLPFLLFIYLIQVFEVRNSFDGGLIATGLTNSL